ncbi:hypothetical protein [Rhodococcus sp. AW25M09]
MADAFVMPKIVAVNPDITTMMIGGKGAEMIEKGD